MTRYGSVHRHQRGHRVARFRYDYSRGTLDRVERPSGAQLGQLIIDAENSALPRVQAAARISLESYESTGYIIVKTSVLQPGAWKAEPWLYMDIFMILERKKAI